MLPWLAVAIIWLADAATGFLQPLERQWSDRVLVTVPRQVSSEVALVTIDDASLARLGRWPWSREVHARLIDRLSEVGARLVVYTVPFVGAESEEALMQLQRIAATVASDPELADHPRLNGLLAQSQDLLDADARLTRSLQQNQRTLLTVEVGVDAKGPVSWPLASLSAAALGVGPLVAAPDEDGDLRKVPLLPWIDGHRLPGLATWAVAVSRGVAPSQLQRRPNATVLRIGHLSVPTDRAGYVHPLWRYPGAPGADFMRVSAAELIGASGPEPRLAGKLVFVGLTAPAAAAAQTLPDGATLAPVEVVAQTASALLTGHVVRQPRWTTWVQAGLVVLVALVLMTVVPRLSITAGLVVSGLLAALLLAFGHLMLSHSRVALPVMLPVVALWVGHGVWLVGQAWRQRWTGEGQHGSLFLDSSAMAPQGAQSLAQLTMSPALPQLGRYQIVREIARGAMGRIYACHDVDTLRPVALKTLALSREFDGPALQDARERFRREASIASRLHHPDIVSLIDAGEDQGLSFIVMELLGGHNLVRYTRAADLMPVPAVLETCARIAEALHHAHQQGVIHRDIKPANVMVDPAQGMVKVMDFGVARVIDGARTRSGIILGSPSYMSPEQLAGRDADGRSDLFSLGVMMFQLLTGELPATGNTMGELIDAVVNLPAPDVRLLRPRLPEAVANIVALALEKRPELRYADGHQLASDLSAVAALWRQTGEVPPQPAGLAWPSAILESMHS